MGRRVWIFRGKINKKKEVWEGNKLGGWRDDKKIKGRLMFGYEVILGKSIMI